MTQLRSSLRFDLTSRAGQSQRVANQCAPLGGGDAGELSERLHACNVGGEEVDTVAVEVASGAVVVLGGPRVGVAREDLGVAKRDASIEGVGDRGVPERVGADVPGDASSPGDASATSAGSWSRRYRSSGPGATASCNSIFDAGLAIGGVNTCALRYGATGRRKPDPDARWRWFSSAWSQTLRTCPRSQ